MSDVPPPPPKTAWAAVYRNREFIAIDTWSGYRSACLDDQGYHVLLHPIVGDEELGQAVKSALTGSRFLTLEEIAAFRDLKAIAARCEARDARWMAHGGYKTKRALFKGMESCSLHACEGQIHLSPMRQERLDGWGGLGKESKLQLPDAATATELGAAVKLALDRSGGK